jgi:2'-hydroxyisoflavone reductase
MRILVLGGTRFLGRHLVERLAGEHHVVCFHRGRSACALPSGVEERLGDRDDDLSAVAAQQWDAIVDTSAFRPEQVVRSLELRTARYLFVSTVNVYENLAVPGVGEEAPTIEAFDESDEAARYGGNKAACERLVLGRYPKTSIILRPGLIAGKWDPTGRFTYWCERMLRGGAILAPGNPGRLVQFADAADIAAFAERLLSNDAYGVYNVAGPAVPTTMAQLLEHCSAVAAQYGAPAAAIVWTDPEFLRENGVEEWSDLPLWLTDPQFAGMLQISNAKALEAGFQPRAIPETVRSVLDWMRTEPSAQRVGLSADRESELLKSYAASDYSVSTGALD